MRLMPCANFFRTLQLISFYILLIIPLWSVAQSYPQKSVKVIVTNPAGGSSDIMARILAQKLGDLWKQTVVVENRGPVVGLRKQAHRQAHFEIGHEILWQLTLRIRGAMLGTKANPVEANPVAREFETHEVGGFNTIAATLRRQRAEGGLA